MLNTVALASLGCTLPSTKYKQGEEHFFVARCHARETEMQHPQRATISIKVNFILVEMNPERRCSVGMLEKTERVRYFESKKSFAG